MTAPVVMYTTSWCPYCERARKLLGAKNVPISEIDIESAPEKRAEMRNRSGRTSVPQIFIGDHHVGGSDDLLALEEAGELDALLGRSALSPDSSQGTDHGKPDRTRGE